MGLHLRYQGTRFWLTRSETVLGRSRSCPIVVDSPVASREHCKLTRIGSDLEVVDLGSKNGTWINGRRLRKPHRLRVGDVVRVGDHTLEVIEEKSEKIPAPGLSRPPEASGEDPTSTLHVVEGLEAVGAADPARTSATPPEPR